ncbi:MAG: DUF1232 domain-containing protein [Cyanothece sp. SIO1E1]|nr:DUF1232 domain-containing protein [Cyanothece sp. SIO1E1]
MQKKFLLQTLQNWYRQAIRNTKYRWLVIVGSLFYLISPIDISPDVFPILGWVDDGLLLTLLVTEVSQLMLEQLKIHKKQKSNTEPTIETAPVIDVEAVSIS